jgi:glycosyltransferase involved in cell wall biosynthesis
VLFFKRVAAENWTCVFVSLELIEFAEEGLLNKKILFITNSSRTTYLARIGLIKKLINDGFSVSVASPEDEFVELLKKAGCKYYKVNIDVSGINPLKDIATFLALYKIIKKVKPELCLNYTIKPNIYGNMAASLQNVPVFSVVPGLGYSFISDGIVTVITKVLYKFSFPHVNKVIFLNNDDRNEFIKNRIVQKEKTVVIPGEGVDTDFFKPLKTERDYDRKVFLFYGRILKDKGFFEFVKAAQIIKNKRDNFVFNVLGFLDEPNPSAVSKEEMDQITSEGIVKYLGVAKDVRGFVADADCIVLPSYREGMPGVLLESMSMGKIVITTSVPGCKDAVCDCKTGFLCKIKSPEDLADKMLKVADMGKNEIEEMGKSARSFVVQNYDEKIVANIILEMIRKFFSFQKLS